jgi:plasmid stabilization system protein ParE
MSPEANDDLDRIYLGIAMAGFPDNAHAFTDKIAAFCQELCRFPNRGTARPEVASGLRTIGFHRQVTIAFHVLEQEKRVVVDRIIPRGGSLTKAFQ